jgi:PAS domain S-box-containing protein
MRRTTALAIAAAAGLFAAILVVWLAIDNSADPPGPLHAPLIALAAVTLVLLGGMLGHHAARRRDGKRHPEEAAGGYREMLERVPAIVYTAGYWPDGRWLYVSPKLESILGYSVEEWYAGEQVWYRALHPDDRAQAVAAEQRSRATGEPLDSEYRMIARDGRVLWFRDQATVVNDEHGRPALLQGVMLDITSRKRAEDELELRYAVQRRLVEAASLNEGLHGVLKTIAARFGWQLASFWALDEHEQVLRLADMWHDESPEATAFEATCRKLNLAPGEGLPGRAWAAGEPVSVEDVTRDPSFPRAAAARACDLHGAVAFPATAGNRVRGVLEFFSREPRKADPEELAVLPSVSALVADFVSMRATIEEARGRFQAVLDNAPAVVYAKDPGGRYLFVNKRFEEVVGLSCEQVEGMTDAELFPADVTASLGANDRRVLETGEQIEIEETVPHADGTHIYLSAKFPLRDATGSVYAVCGISTDVTEFKRVRQELDRREELVRANRAKSAFLSRVSHELRTPLNAILGFGQVLEVDSITDRQRNAVEQIMKGGRHLLELVNDLLEASRIESGELSVSLAEVDVGAAVDDIAHLLEPLAAERQVSIVSRTSPEAPLALADGQRLKQVLLNLVSNAIKYNRHGGGVDLHVLPAGQGRVAVRITDTGCGIAPEDIERLFSPFERLGAEQTTIEGTGLGLALSKLMVEAMNGSLEVESMPDVGSTFTVELPAASVTAEPVQQDPVGKALAHSGR